jgi:DNA-binding transcriptional regulator YiaG
MAFVSILFACFCFLLYFYFKTAIKNTNEENELNIKHKKIIFKFDIIIFIISIIFNIVTTIFYLLMYYALLNPLIYSISEISYLFIIVFYICYLLILRIVLGNLFIDKIKDRSTSFNFENLGLIYKEKISFGKKIKEIRKNKNMTQLELASNLNVTVKTIYKWEQGVTFPTVEEILSLSQIFNMDLFALILEVKNE